MPQTLRQTLTPREREVLGLLAAGTATRVMADRLFVSVKTIESHCHHIKEKCGLQTMRQLIVYAVYYALAHTNASRLRL
jgi:DNA-binding NarL/FixJ family response regulator